MSIVTERGFFLGKKDPVESPFPEFKTYLHDAPNTLIATSAHYGKRVGVPWQMDGNGPDSTVTIAPANWPGCGDCVECGKAHALTTANYCEYGVTLPVPTSDVVVEQYCTAQSCTPAQLFSDPNTYDNGEDITNSLTTWCTTEEYGCKLGFTAPVNQASRIDICNAIYLCGGLDVGIQLPESAEEQFPNEWTWQPSSPIAGGHCVWLTGYTEDYVALVTWGALIQCTWQFLMNTIDEAHALVLPQAISAGKNPTGLELSVWEADLKNLNRTA